MKRNTLKRVILTLALPIGVFLTVSVAGFSGIASALVTSPGCPAGTPATDTACQNNQDNPGGSDCGSSSTFCASASDGTARYGCGSNGKDNNGLVVTSIDFGCKGDACNPKNPNYGKDAGGYCSSYHNGILDLIFAIIRILSDGVGIVVIGSIIIAGIRYTTSQGDPAATAAAIGRIRTSLIALLIFIFSYAILNYLIPDGFFS